jgi:hypothetical protein
MPGMPEKIQKAAEEIKKKTDGEYLDDLEKLIRAMIKKIKN